MSMEVEVPCIHQHGFNIVVKKTVQSFFFSAFIKSSSGALIHV